MLKFVKVMPRILVASFFPDTVYVRHEPVEMRNVGREVSSTAFSTRHAEAVQDIYVVGYFTYAYTIRQNVTPSF